MRGYWARVEWLAVTSRFAKLRKSLGFMTLWRLYLYETLLEGLAQDLQDMAAELRQLIQQEHTVAPATRRPAAAPAPPISLTSEMVWCGARHGRVVTTAVRSPVRPATRWMRVVSIASARVVVVECW
jgi:hypothetical protein